ncbi:GABRB [Lepeophtheirus salmonis]|uniref:Gamma-aminobutyric acid receptor subunit beta n=1 Tax=Lepeophtheirus salmonis TaxID=72036 RepID=A0A7R8CQS5_LEPSM|nr:GABRB [Lepeophtheirus salmonis]CAF2898382.1 GABRB [Lepeophtheirus salmonis]
MCILFLILSFVWSVKCGALDGNANSLENVTRTIGNLLDGYDIRLRPNFGGDPLYVGFDLTIASFDSISEVSMDYTITMYLNQYWKDERLSFSTEEDKVLTLSGDFSEKIWVPDTFFANDKKQVKQNKMVRLHGDGAITYGMRFTTTLACMMDLHYYPLDSQNCTVEIESYGYTVSDVVMYWRQKPVVGVEDAQLPQFTIVGWETNERKIKLATGTYQRLSLSFKLQRNIGYFVFQTYLPSILIVMLSWVSFWINHEATSARVALGITTVLTMTTISTGVRSSLPRISYYAAVNYTYWGARAKKKKKEKKKEKADQKLTEEDPQSSSSKQPEEDIIELQDLRMSPIPSIRNRFNSSSSSGKIDSATGFPPSFRINRSTHHHSIRPSRKNNIKTSSQHKKKLMGRIRKGSAIVKSILPQIKDVNIIDKYSRIIFPVSFLLFNVAYWCFYVVEV